MDTKKGFGPAPEKEIAFNPDTIPLRAGSESKETGVSQAALTKRFRDKVALLLHGGGIVAVSRDTWSYDMRDADGTVYCVGISKRSKK